MSKAFYRIFFALGAAISLLCGCAIVLLLLIGIRYLLPYVH